MAVSPFAWASIARAAGGRHAPALAAAEPAFTHQHGNAAGVLGWLEGWGKLAEEMGCSVSTGSALAGYQGCASSPDARLLADASVHLR